jgi:hypothetical protein
MDHASGDGISVRLRGIPFSMLSLVGTDLEFLLSADPYFSQKTREMGHPHEKQVV